MKLTFRYRYLVFAALGVMLLVLPLFLSPFWLHLAIFTLFYVYLCQAWNIPGGLSGLIVFLHPSFIAIGAYSVAILHTKLGVSPWLGIILGMVLSIMLAIGVTWVGLRYKMPKLTFGLITLGIINIVMFVFEGFRELTGGTDGMRVLSIEPRPWHLFFPDKAGYYYIILAMAVGIIPLCYFIIQRSKLGFYLKAIRDNDRAAAAIGINQFRYVVTGMIISSVLTSLAGSFYAVYMRFVDPVEVAGAMMGINMILFTIIGGLGTLWGPVLGAAVIYPIGKVTTMLIGSRFAGLDLLIYGVMVVLVVMFMPTGIWGQLMTMRSRWTKRARETNENQSG